MHTIIISEFLIRELARPDDEQIPESGLDDILIVAPIAALPFVKRLDRLGVVAPFSEFRPAKATGLSFIVHRHTIIISEFLQLAAHRSLSHFADVFVKHLFESLSVPLPLQLSRENFIRVCIQLLLLDVTREERI